MNSGSLESFKVSWRCGWSPNACQIRSTAFWVRPTSAAIERVDQCVASLGVLSNVLHDHLLDLLVGDRPRPPRPRLIAQPVKPMLGEAVAPLGDHRATGPQLLGDLGVRQARGRQQHDPRAQRQRLRGRAPPRPATPAAHARRRSTRSQRQQMKASTWPSLTATELNHQDTSSTWGTRSEPRGGRHVDRRAPRRGRERALDLPRASPGRCSPPGETCTRLRRESRVFR